jgi:hypothetical protein
MATSTNLVGDTLNEFTTYEEYLDSQILPEDLKYIEVSSISFVERRGDK